MAKPIPEGYQTLTPIIVFKDTRKAIEFYKKALSAQERFVMPAPDGRVMHAEMKIGSSIVMMSDEHPQHTSKSAQSLGGSAVAFYLYVPDADATFKQAVAAGATAKMSVQDMFWGDRMGNVVDPFGHSWMISTHVKDLNDEQIEQGAKETMARKS